MKKLASIILSAALILSLAACGASAPAADPGASAPAQSAPAKSEPAKASPAQYVLKDEVIVDNDVCTVTLVGGEATKNGGAEFKFMLENKTGGKNLVFSMDPTVANGWEILTLFAETVAPGKKTNETLEFTASDMEEHGLTSVDKLQFGLRVYDDDDWMEDAFVDEVFTLYPTGLSEDQVVSPEVKLGPAAMPVVDTDEYTYVILDAKNDKIWGYTLDVYLENKTDDKTLMFSWDDVSVNGFMVDTFAAEDATAGNKTYGSITFSTDDFEKNGIDPEKVEEIEFTLRVYDEEDWMADDIFKGTFTYRPTK